MEIKIRSGSLVSDTLLTTLLTAIGRGVGFAVPFFVAAWFGVTEGTDAFFYVYGLILLLAGIFAPVVQSVIVPFIAQTRAENETEVRRFLGGTLVVSMLGLTAVGVLFLLIARPILSVVSDFSSESLDLISRLLLETIPLLALLVATSLLSGALNAYKKFSLPAVSPGLRAVIALIIIMTLKDRIGVHAIALGYVGGELVRCGILLFYASRVGIGPTVRSLALDSRLLRFLKLASYQVAGMIALTFTPIVDKTMASWLAPGSVSILEYANRLYDIPVTFIQSGFFVVLLSHWSAQFYERSQSHFRREVVKTAGIVGAGALVLSVMLILFREPLVSLVYGRGEFPMGHIASVQVIWAIYLIGLGPTLFGRVFSRAHLVLKNTRLLMVMGITNLSVKVVLNLLLVGPLGLPGLALSTTIAYSGLAIVFMICFLRANIGGEEAGGSPSGGVQIGRHRGGKSKT